MVKGRLRLRLRLRPRLRVGVRVGSGVEEGGGGYMGTQARLPPRPVMGRASRPVLYLVRVRG